MSHLETATTGAGLPPAQGTARLITDRAEQSKLTLHREVDAFNALTRGLKEYMEQLSVNDNGRLFRLKVFDNWPDFEERAEYPSAVMEVAGPALYDPKSFTPNVSSTDLVSGKDYAIAPTEMVQSLTMQVWANNSKEREVLGYMIEDAMSPVLWMYSLRLELPFYFNQRAEYELTAVSQLDDAVSATKRIRKSVYEITARIPVTKIVSLPLTRAGADVTAQESVLT